MCKSLIAVNMSLPSRRSNNVLTACQIWNWFWNCFNEAMNKFAGAWPSERAQRHQPKSPAVALLTVHEWGQRVAVWLPRICQLWAGISVPAPTSEVPCISDLFWGMCVRLPSAVFPPVKCLNKYLQLKGLSWFFSKAQGRDYKFLLVLHPIGVQGTLRVMHLPDLSLVLPIKLIGGLNAE